MAANAEAEIEARGYAHPELLASTGWLAGHLDDPSIRIVDCDFPGGFERAHIPGAVRVVDNYYKSEDRVHVQGPEEFAETMASLGISSDTTVVAYDSDRSHFAPRLFWALRLYGHDNAKVLDGGYAKWFAEGQPLERKRRQYPRGTFTARPERPAIALKEYMLSQIGSSETVFWDVRTDEEWTGENDRGTARGGRIPGAVHLEWSNLVTDGDVPVFRSADEMRFLLEGAGVTPDKNVVAY